MKFVILFDFFLDELLRDLESLGAVDVRELRPGDWRALASWSALREMERRRLLRAAEDRAV